MRRTEGAQGVGEQSESFELIDDWNVPSRNLGEKKGWIGWKEASLFRSEAFYNLMCPQRPQTI